MLNRFKRSKEERELIWWFEIPVGDLKRAQLFYETILQLKMTLEENELYKTAFFPIYKDRIGGALVCGQGYTPSGDGAKIFLNGHKNLQAILDKVEAAGGKILVPKTKNTTNYYAWIMDTEGNKIGIVESKN
jgi:uncharacterized protein